MAEQSKALHLGTWVAQGLMAFAFLGAGALKITTSQPDLVEAGMAWAGRVPEPLGMVIGILEVLGAVGLILPAALRIVPVLTPIAAGCLTLTMVVAGLEHAAAGEFANLPPNVVLGAICGFIAYSRLKLAPIEAK